MSLIYKLKTPLTEFQVRLIKTYAYRVVQESEDGQVTIKEIVPGENARSKGFEFFEGQGDASLTVCVGQRGVRSVPSTANYAHALLLIMKALLGDQMVFNSEWASLMGWSVASDVYSGLALVV